MSVADDLLRFHAMLTSLQHRQGGPKPFRDFDLSLVPRAGVYFIFEEGSTDSTSASRLVRVGTHRLAAGSRSTLGQRLAQHRGSRDGSGNHRGSIFRLLVGQALMRRGDHPVLSSWGIAPDMGNAAARLGRDRKELKEQERPLELQASKTIGAMSVVVLGIDDPAGPESLRGLIERGAIGLFSSPEARALHPSPSNWLGHYSSREAVRSSSLWNIRHVGEGYDSGFLDIMEKLVG